MTATCTIAVIGISSVLYTKIHIENKIALETINPERIKDSRNAKNNTNNHAYSALAFKYISIFSNIGYLILIKDSILLY